LRELMRVSASATAISLPDRLSVQSEASRPEELVARRLLISASPGHGAAGVSVLGSTLTTVVVGGTFGGSATVADVARDRALEIIPGRLRIEPFLESSRLHAQTVGLDVIVVPGGVPADKMTVSLSPLWTPERHPVPPDALQVIVSAGRHLTVFDVVEAHVSLDLVGTGPGRSRSIWKCTYETGFTLVDHESVLPALWDLRVASRDGKPKRWLALFEPAAGPFRAVFADPAAAQAFATWLRETGATRAGRYQLGLFEADASGSHFTLPADRNIASTFQPASAHELQALTDARLGDN
jgi:hypothetical protein